MNPDVQQQKMDFGYQMAELAASLDPEVLGVVGLPDGQFVPVTQGIMQEAVAMYFSYFLPTGQVNGWHAFSDGTGNFPGEEAIRVHLPEGFTLLQYLESGGGTGSYTITFAAIRDGADPADVAPNDLIAGTFTSLAEAIARAEQGVDTLAAEAEANEDAEQEAVETGDWESEGGSTES